MHACYYVITWYRATGGLRIITSHITFVIIPVYNLASYCMHACKHKLLNTTCLGTSLRLLNLGANKFILNLQTFACQ